MSRVSMLYSLLRQLSPDERRNDLHDLLKLFTKFERQELVDELAKIEAEESNFRLKVRLTP